MDGYFLYATKDTRQPDKLSPDRGKVSDIIKMSQDISGDWLKKEAQKKVVIQEQIQEQKNKPQDKKSKSDPNK